MDLTFKDAGPGRGAPLGGTRLSKNDLFFTKAPVAPGSWQLAEEKPDIRNAAGQQLPYAAGQML